MPKISYAEEVSRHDGLLGAIRSNAALLGPRIMAKAAAIEESLALVRALQARQRKLEADRRKAIQDRDAAVARLLDLVRSARLVVRSELGAKDAALVQFGIHVRRRPRRKPAGATATLAEASQETPEASPEHASLSVAAAEASPIAHQPPGSTPVSPAAVPQPWAVSAGDGADLPEDGGEAPGLRAKAPGDGARAPGVGGRAPGDGGRAPDPGAPPPADGGDRAELRATPPPRGAEAPELGARPPGLRAKLPEIGAAPAKLRAIVPAVPFRPALRPRDRGAGPWKRSHDT